MAKFVRFINKTRNMKTNINSSAASNSHKGKLIVLFSAIFILIYHLNLNAQTEVMAWGNITGIRIDGQLMEFETGFTIADPQWNKINSTGRERQRPKYDRDGNRQIVNTRIGNIGINQIVEDKEPGSANVSISITSDSDTTIAGVFFTIYLPDNKYNNGNVRLIKASSGGKADIPLGSLTDTRPSNTIKVTAKGLKVEAKGIMLEFLFDASLPVQIIRASDNNGAQVLISLAGQKIKKGTITKRNINIISSGEIDHSQVEITVDSKNPGRRYSAEKKPPHEQPAIECKTIHLRSLISLF